jgi:hypothetical protein
MKKQIFYFVMLALIVLGCNNGSTNKNTEGFDAGQDPSTYLNSSQHGSKYPETFILMQNRMGVRIEYCADRSTLQLWLSPQAAKSMSYVDRNWSNRDDHMNLFDRIRIPGCDLKNFVKCDYDPFYSVIHFKEQDMHILNLTDQPVVIVWFGKDASVDFKSDMNDKPIERSEKRFIVEHPDRGRTFDFAAVIGEGEGKFRQQMQVEYGRSMYCRASLKANQPLVITGELKEENISALAESIAKMDMNKLKEENEIKINKALDFGKFRMRNRPEMQKLLDINKRVAYSMQDEKGFMRSTNQYIYYLLWYRDGGMDATHIGYTGWITPMKWQANFALHNPNTSLEDPKGIYFGQLMSGTINKFEEDGLFYVVWSAFSYWTMSGDDVFCKGEYMKTMEDALDWLERQCYNKEKGLFGRYYACESAFTDHRDNGWDNAIGRPEDYYETKYKDTIIVRAYDMYINNLTYATYLMLASMETGPKADEYQKKAEELEKNMRKFYENKEALPLYGDLLTKKGNYITADCKVPTYGMDVTDYQWSLSLPPFTPNIPVKYKAAREQLRKDLGIKSFQHGIFICGYAAILTAMDNEIHNEDSIMAALDELVPKCVRPGKYLPMPYTIQEMADVEDGNPYHDVRPLVFSIGPWMSAVSNLAVRKLPFGIAVRGTKYMSSIDNIEYMGGLVDVKFSGEGLIKKVTVNGSELTGTYQIPDQQIHAGDNTVTVEMSKEAKPANILISSSVRLLTSTNGKYEVLAYVKNVLVFKNLSKNVVIADSEGKTVSSDVQKVDNLTYIEFKGRGKYSIELK